MIPVVTPTEMAAIDRNADDPVDVLIKRAGGVVARAALDVLGGSYGRRVVVLAGKGNNGNDGREAARRLRSRGVRVVEIDALSFPESLPRADLVIDAAFGTGFRGDYRAPIVSPDVPVLAVDIPSGVDGLTGTCSESVIPADLTVTFAALKQGLLFGPGATMCGDVRVADIGLDTSSVRTHLVEEADFVRWLPERPRSAHKWDSAVCVVGGGHGMEGAATLTTRAALRAGAGYVRWSAPGGVSVSVKPDEVVGVDLLDEGWSVDLLRDSGRFEAFVVGNGLGLSPTHSDDLAELVGRLDVPVIVDADAITLLGSRAQVVGGPTVVFTPHDKEFERISGDPPGPDRVDAVKRLAERIGSVVLLKGPTTVVAEPGGAVLVCDSGDQRLATLGTGDVLAGIVAAFCARGLDPFHAAAAGAFIHGRAARLGWRDGLIASDVIAILPKAMAQISGLGDDEDETVP